MVFQNLDEQNVQHEEVNLGCTKKTWGGSVVFLGLGTPNFGDIRQWLLFKSGKNCDVYVGQGTLELSNNHDGQAKLTASQKENTVQNIFAWRWFLELVGKRLWETEDSQP